MFQKQTLNRVGNGHDEIIYQPPMYVIVILIEYIRPPPVV